LCSFADAFSHGAAAAFERAVLYGVSRALAARTGDPQFGLEEENQAKIPLQ